jgi:hypothetical protein
MHEGTGLLFSIDARATDELLLAVAQAEYSGVASVEEARTRCAAFNIDALLDLAAPEWQDHDKPHRHMGEMTHRLWHLTYVCFTNCHCAPAPVRYPQGFHAKSVVLADVYEPPHIGKGGRAFLSVFMPHSQPILVAFPRIGSSFAEPTKDDNFARSEQAFRQMLRGAVERVNLVVPAARTLDEREID